MLALPVPQFPLEKSQDKIRASPWRWGEESRDSPTPPSHPGRVIIDFQKRQNPRKLPAVAQNLVSMEIIEEGGGGKGAGGRTGARCPTSGKKCYRWDNVQRTFCVFCCKSLLFFSPRTTFTPRPCTQKKGKDEDAPEGVYQNQRMLQPPKPQCNHLYTTHPPPPPPNLPPLHFWGKKPAFLAPSTPSMVGAAGGEGNGRAAPGPHSHDLSSPARCYIEVEIFLFNLTAAKSTNRSVAASRPHFPPPRGAAHACAWLCAHVCHPSRRLTGARTTPFYFSF